MARKCTYHPFILFALMLAITGAALAPVSAFGIPEGRIVMVGKPVSEKALADNGMLMLADLRDAYLVQGTEVAAKRLGDMAPGYRIIASTSPGKDVYLLQPQSLQADLLYSGALTKVAERTYLAQLDPDEASGLDLLPFSMVRLRPVPFASRRRQSPPERLMDISPKPEIETVVAGVSGDTLWKYIAELSGEVPVTIGGMPDTLLTRYTFSEKIDEAADYLGERFSDCGMDVEFQEYVQGKYSFYDLDFIDENYGWVAGYTRCFKTSDGGLTWIKRKPVGFNHVYQDICFLDSLEGWVVGAPGLVYHTTDGGVSWTKQFPPAGMSWIYDVFFLDPLTGWIAGSDGGIGVTTDGGQTWTSQESGTAEYLYGLWFASATRGWACGAGGTILFWDGAAWSSQTSGVSDFLRDLCFVDDNTGWTVGADRAALKTTDGGQTWTPMPVPASANPYLMDVCFVDSTEGWIPEYDGTILHTTDGGASWEVQYSEGAPQLYAIDFVSATQGWTDGLASAVQHTADGGATWGQQTTNLPSGAWAVVENVIATKPGTTSEEQVIICGHYDSISGQSAVLAPGADDNASGVAAVLEAARLLAPGFYERTTKFVCFAGEEQGLLGSGEYAGRAHSAGDSIVAVLNLDMIGYVDVAPEDFNIVCDSASEWLADFTLDCAAAYVPARACAKTVNPEMISSDHASFWRLGYEAIYGSEDWPVTYPYIHTIGDTLGNMDKALATDIVKVAVSALAELAVPDPTAAVAGRPETALIASAWPNPFIQETRIGFVLGRAERVRVSLFDVNGRLVKTLAHQDLPPGRHEAVWDGTDGRGSRVSPGIYFARISTNSAGRETKVVLLR